MSCIHLIHLGNLVDSFMNWLKQDDKIDIFCGSLLLLSCFFLDHPRSGIIQFTEDPDCRRIILVRLRPKQPIPLMSPILSFRQVPRCIYFVPSMGNICFFWVRWPFLSIFIQSQMLTWDIIRIYRSILDRRHSLNRHKRFRKVKGFFWYSKKISTSNGLEHFILDSE